MADIFGRELVFSFIGHMVEICVTIISISFSMLTNTNTNDNAKEICVECSKQYIIIIDTIDNVIFCIDNMISMIRIIDLCDMCVMKSGHIVCG